VGETPHHADVLAPGEVLVDGGVLAGQADDLAHRLGFFHHVATQDGGPTAIGVQDGGQDAHGGRLAGAVGAEQAEDRALLDMQRHAVEGADVAAREDLDEVVRLDGVRGIITH
jgi:hypothetical protein